MEREVVHVERIDTAALGGRETLYRGESSVVWRSPGFGTEDRAVAALGSMADAVRSTSAKQDPAIERLLAAILVTTPDLPAYRLRDEAGGLASRRTAERTGLHGHGRPSGSPLLAYGRGRELPLTTPGMASRADVAPSDGLRDDRLLASVAHSRSLGARDVAGMGRRLSPGGGLLPLAPLGV